MSAITLESWIEHLRYLFAPAGLIHVGAGGGEGVVPYADWSIENVMLIDADDRHQRAMAQLTNPTPGWHSVKALIYKDAGETDFFLASNPSENGLIVPESLKPIWPNLKTASSTRIATTRIDDLLSEFGSHFNANWLIISCLPATQIVESMGGYLDNIEVLIARVTLLTTTLNDTGADLASLDRLLTGSGFRCLQVTESRQPLIGHVVYIRDNQQEIIKLSLDRDQLAKVAVEREEQFAAMSMAWEEQAQIVTELQIQVGKLFVERDEQARFALERQVQLDATSMAREEQAKIIAGLKEQEIKLTSKLAMITEEFLEAEAQVEVIKELLIGADYSPSID